MTSVLRELLGSAAADRPDVADVDLLDLGVDSLTLFRIRARVAQLTGVVLDVPSLFAAPTLRALAGEVDAARR